MEELLHVDKVSKRFKRRLVLDDVSFSLQRGEVLGLIGPNGSGKTTLLECLAGLLPANDGTVKLGEKPIPAARRKEVLFYLPDAIVPWAQQSVQWAIDFFKELYRRSRSEAHAMILSLRLEALKKSNIGSLSKGERKRLLLGLGLLTSQPFLLLDEPFDGLDLRQTRDVMSLLKEHASGGRTLLLSIHQLVDAGRVCDRLVLLNDGRVAGDGTIAELREKAGLPEGGVEEVFLALT